MDAIPLCQTDVCNNLIAWVPIMLVLPVLSFVKNSQSFFMNNARTLLLMIGRYDIARALEKWGGVHEVSRLLSLELRRPRRRANSDDESKAGSSYAITNKHASKPNKPSVSPDKQKWLLKLKDLDANWIEY
jgi:hypothetical protein